MDLLRTVARPLLAASFVVDGVDAVTHPSRHVAKVRPVTRLLERAGVPEVGEEALTLASRVSGAVCVAAGLGLSLGVAPRACAATLAAVNVPLTVLNSPVWEVSRASGPQERAQARSAAVSGLWRGAALSAGLVMAALDRGGRPSAAWWLANERAHRAELAAVREATAQAVTQAVASRYREV